MKKITSILLLFILFTGCALKPKLTPINISNVDIQKDGKMFFKFVDSHQKVIMKNRTNFAGTHHDVDENNFNKLNNNA